MILFIVYLTSQFKDHPRDVELTMVLCFADVHQVGFSKVIWPISVNKKMVCEIILKGKKYISNGKVLLEFRARRVLGRGTRVLEVY